MQTIKKFLCAVLCLALLAALAGCSTPQVALTVDGKDYSTGEYLANLYNQYSSAYNSSLYYYEYYGQDIWSQTFPYGEDEEMLGLADYLIASTQDVIVRQKAVENMMKEYDITLSKEEETELAKNLASVAESDVLALGFNKENYGKMVRAFNYNETALFYGLYKEGGKRAVSKADLETYVKENFLSYQMFSIALVSSNGSELEANVKTAVKEFLGGYLKEYNKSGDMAAVFKAYLANVKKGVTLKDDAGKTLATLSWKNGEAVITLPDAKKDTDTTKEETEDPTCERENNDVSVMDEDLAKAIKKIKEGEAAVTTYSAGGSTDTAAVIVRFAPLSGKGSVDLSKDETVENVIYYAKFDAFDEEVEKAADKLEVTVNSRAIKMCRPEYFDPNYEKGQTTTTSTTTTTAATTTTVTTTTTTTTAAK